MRKLFKLFLHLLFKLSFIEKPLPSNPFGKKIRASKEKYMALHLEAINRKDSEISKFEKNYGYNIDKEWFDELALHTQACIKKTRLNYSHGKLLYCVLNKYLNRKTLKKSSKITILETGTARGFSSIIMSKVLIENKVNGQIITIDCIPHNQKILWNCIDDFQGPKTRAELLEKWKKELSNITFIQGWTRSTIKKIGLSRINFAFLDAQHTKEDVLEEFRFINDRQAKGDIIFFDDVTPNLFQGVCDAVNEIEKNYQYKIKRLFFSKDRSYAIAEKF